MVLYIDTDYKCHTAPAEGRRAVETTAFDGKCSAYIEGYRFVPAGETWVREDGAEFTGEMIAPWKPWETLDAAQREYEREQYQEITAQNAELVDAMAAMVEDVYTSDIAGIEEG